MIRNLLKILGYQIGVGLVFSALLTFSGSQDSTRYHALFLWGGLALSAANFILLYLSWALVFTKKKVAPLIFAVVSKYAILGLVLWSLSPLAVAPMAFFVLGVLSNSVALVLFGILGKNTKTGQNHVI